ncbi:MAG: alpha-amylase [Oscillospiraceae bacterium]|nr:alpha-amylase [Oscillospiraceae bacterium]
MAKDTDRSLQNQIIYSVFVRDHTEEGTFLSMIGDLDRIRALGTDIIWFLPIHPIGIKEKKGSLGCPYANRDYRSTNPLYGSMEDFRTLAEEIHARGMKVMIDVVYNHTSPDAVLLQEHPEFYYRDAEGRTGNKIGDWADVIDLDYSCRALWTYQIESLCMWAQIVDGFRCDVASFVPVEFWKAAREAVSKVKPGCIWLAETVHLAFGNYARSSGFYSSRDSEAYEAFDIEYQYDIWECFERFLRGEAQLSAWTELLDFQEAVYPENYNKLRYLENHDQPRIRGRVRTDSDLENYTAMLYFLKGTTLLYAGQEFSSTHKPSLFEREVIRRDGKDISPYLQKLAEIKKTVFTPEDSFTASADDAHQIAVMERNFHGRKTIGIFSLRSESAVVKVEVPDGIYRNLIDGKAAEVTDGSVRCDGRPMLFRTDEKSEG